MKVTRNEWLLRFRQGKGTVDGDDGGVAVDSVDAVEIDRVLGLPPVETVGDDDACGGRSVRIGRRRRGSTMCHVSITASSIIVYVCGLLFILHERAS